MLVRTSMMVLDLRTSLLKSSWPRIGVVVSFVTFLLLVLIPGLESATQQSTTILTKSNYDDVTANKTVFIKWAAPWCGHSQDLAPAWDQLVQTSFVSEKDSSSSSSLLIAEVDCSEQEAWCIEMGYTAYPTLTYGDPSMGGIFLLRYESLAKSVDDLIRFTQTTLVNKSFCTPGNVQACDGSVQERIQLYMAMTKTELQGAIGREEMLLREADQSFDRTAKLLQAEYDGLSKTHQMMAAKIKKSIKLMKDVAKKTNEEQ